MTVKVISEQEVLQEAMEVLLEHMDPAKAARFWSAWQMGGGNYLALREQLFAGETVTTLFEKIQAYEKRQEQGVIWDRGAEKNEEAARLHGCRSGPAPQM